MWSNRPKPIAVKFIHALSGSDASAALSMLADDVTYTDSRGYGVEGRDACSEALRRFFEMDLDFRIDPERVSQRGNEVLVSGSCSAKDARLNAKCLWRITVVDGKIAEYRSYRAESPPAFAKVLIPEAVV